MKRIPLCPFMLLRLGGLGLGRHRRQRPNFGKDQRIPQLQRQVVPPVVAQDGLEVKAGAAGDGRAARVALVTVDLDAVGAQRVNCLLYTSRCV